MADHLDLPHLIKVLSTPRHLLHALRVRNILLAPILERGLDSKDTKACWDAWVLHHGIRSSVEVFGDVPSSIEDDIEDKLFGVIVISYGLRTIGGNPAIDLYISHEPLVGSSSLNGLVPPATPEGSILFERMYREALVPSALKWDVSEAMFFGINRCWTDVVAGEHVYLGNCTRVAKKLEQGEFESPVKAPTGYRVRRATAEDCATILEASSHPRPIEYYQSRIYFSAVVETEDDNRLVAWALTHDDLSIGSLHTVEGHRKRGLANVIVSEISQQFVKHFSRSLVSTSPIYIHADCEAYNEAAVKAFRRMGFDHTHFVAWLGVKLELGNEIDTS